MYFAFDPESPPSGRDWRRSGEQEGVGDGGRGMHRWDGSELRLGWTEVKRKSAAGRKEGDRGEGWS